MERKPDNDTYDVLTLISMLGMTEIGDRLLTDELYDFYSDTVSRGLVKEQRGIYTDPPAMDTFTFSFKLTKKGYRYLGGFTLVNLLWRWRNFGYLLGTRDHQYALIYIVKRLSIEQLPEFLTHSIYEKVRKAAKARLEELS